MLVEVREAFEEQAFHVALDRIWSVVRAANVYVDHQAPWALRKEDPVRMQTVLFVLVEVIRRVAILIQPVVPVAAGNLLDQLGIAQDAGYPQMNCKKECCKKAWENTQLQSRKCYLTKKTPSSKTKIPEDGLPKHLQGVDPSRDESETGYENFTVIENIIKNIDWLRLDSSGHKRLNINLINNEPKFDWLIP